MSFPFSQVMSYSLFSYLIFFVFLLLLLSYCYCYVFASSSNLTSHSHLYYLLLFVCLLIIILIIAPVVSPLPLIDHLLLSSHPLPKRATRKVPGLSALGSKTVDNKAQPLAEKLETKKVVSLIFFPHTCVSLSISQGIPIFLCFAFFPNQFSCSVERQILWWASPCLLPKNQGKYSRVLTLVWPALSLEPEFRPERVQMLCANVRRAKFRRFLANIAKKCGKHFCRFSSFNFRQKWPQDILWFKFFFTWYVKKTIK